MLAGLIGERKVVLASQRSRQNRGSQSTRRLYAAGCNPSLATKHVSPSTLYYAFLPLEKIMVRLVVRECPKGQKLAVLAMGTLHRKSDDTEIRDNRGMGRLGSEQWLGGSQGIDSFFTLLVRDCSNDT